MKYYLLSALVVLIDQLSKILTVQHIDLHEEIQLIPGSLTVLNCKNTSKD